MSTGSLVAVADLAGPQDQAGPEGLAPPKRRSYSQLSTYTECPESYYYKYVEKVPEDPSVWSVGGTTFHTLAEQFLLGEMGPNPTARDVSLAWAKAWFEGVEEVLQRNPHATPDLRKWRKANRGAEDEQWWDEAGQAFVRQMIRWWNEGGGALLTVLEDETGKYVEREMTVQLGGVEVIAIPDLLAVDEHGQVDVVDWKSSRDQAGPKDPLQLGVYKAATMVATDYLPAFGLYYMTRSAIIQLRRLDRYNPTTIGDLFADFDFRERSGQYPPRPGDACRYCPFKRDRCSVKGKIPQTSQEAA